MTYLGLARQSDRSRGIGIGALPALVIASALSLVVAACGSSTSTINGNDASVNGKGGTTGGIGTGGTPGGTGTGGAAGPACGGSGQACCAANTCNGGGCCVGGMCVGAGMTCGNGNTTGTCTNGSCQNAAGTACGAIGQICCGANGGTTCTASGARCTLAAGGGADGGADTVDVHRVRQQRCGLLPGRRLRRRRRPDLRHRPVLPGRRRRRGADVRAVWRPRPGVLWRHVQ